MSENPTTTLKAPEVVVKRDGSDPTPGAGRPAARGKFLFVGEEKLYLCGVTYGAFRPGPDGNEFHDLEAVDRDFALMAEHGVNTVRIPHTTPPRALLDVAGRHGLWVMVGLSGEQYAGYLIDRKGAPDVEAEVRERAQAVAGHPALLAYALGNEIPASLVRWLGRRRVERYLERLCRAVKEVDPGGLVTYVNYPTTEYLDLPFLDFLSFNVYLESRDRLEAYLPRLHNLAGERPLVMSEVGLDSLRNGEDEQARVLDWQLRTAFAAGCAGAFVFAWTDEWYRGGGDVDDWAFGLTDREREPKPALAAVRRAYAEVPFPTDLAWPKISGVVCTYNGSRTIRDCCEGLLALDYPDYEVIVVDDGSTDDTARIVAEYPFRLISTENRGLSAARNTGLEAATGEIVAYLDDDARPDRHWLTYLARSFTDEAFDGFGGPNVAPDDGAVAECVARAPGGPTHVLVSDTEAEHIPGCNMAFRKPALEAVGGFDRRFRIAGDDVDLCWRLQRAGSRLGFSPAAMVWHRCRGSIGAYWKQQLNYGKAEGLLEMKWPERYNAVGHLRWRGRLYGGGLVRAFARRPRIYHGVWGSGPFQSLYEAAPGRLSSLLLMPEWYLIMAVLLALSLLGVVWQPLFLALPLFALALSGTLAQAVTSSGRARSAGGLGRRALTTWLYLLQPAARLAGRLSFDLTPWRRRGAPHFAVPWPRQLKLWTESWREPEKRLADIEMALRRQGAVVHRGGDFDRWDLEVRGGLLGAVRGLMAVEDHGSGTQLVRFRVWPRWPGQGLALLALFAALAAAAALAGAWPAAAILAAAAMVLALRGLGDSAAATASFRRVLRAQLERPPLAETAPEETPAARTVSVLRSAPDEHPAAVYWNRLGPGHPAPRAVTVLEEARWNGGEPRTIYLLEGAGAGGGTIAARCAPAPAARVECVVYEEILPRVPAPAARFYGAVAEADGECCWLFLEHAGGDPYSADSSEHRAAVGHTLGRLHAATARLPALARLPHRGPDHYRELLRATRESLVSYLSGPAVNGADRLTLTRITEHCQFLAAHWHRAEELCSVLPTTLVHGDFVGDKLRLRSGGGGAATVVPADWESAGRGVPAADLVRLADRADDAAIEAYWSVIRRSWQDLGLEDLRALIPVGVVFRWITALHWENARVPADLEAGYLARAFGGVYATAMASAIDAVDWEGQP